MGDALASKMKLNQVTLPATDLAVSIGFYQQLGFVPIVKDDYYSRLEILRTCRRYRWNAVRMPVTVLTSISSATISMPVSRR